MSDESTKFRRPTEGELRLLRALLDRSHSVSLDEGWLDRVRVASMDDGGMGSVRLSVVDESGPRERLLGQVAAELQFTDEDGVEVLVSLNMDQEGELFEMDVWKTDFKPLIRIPERLP